jgi:hypothetical protein
VSTHFVWSILLGIGWAMVRARPGELGGEEGIGDSGGGNDG